MVRNRSLRIDPGDEPAIVAAGSRRPDRRQISTRWLIGAILTGMTSCTLMGVALFAALDGREQLATPPELLGQDEMPVKIVNTGNIKGDRLIATRPRKTFDDKRRLELSTVQKVGEREVVRSQAFELVNIVLAEEQQQVFDYPKFNALNLFDEAPVPVVNADLTAQIYGSKLESEISLQMREFPQNGAAYNDSDSLSTEEVERAVRTTASSLGNGVTKIAALHYINPLQIGGYNQSMGFSDSLDVKIVRENVSVAAGYTDQKPIESYSEDIVPFPQDENVLSALNEAGYSGQDAVRIANSLSLLVDSEELEAGSVLRLGIETNRFGQDNIVRASIYKDSKHVLSIALDDNNNFVRCDEPEMTPLLRAAFEGGAPVVRVAAENLPTVYDAVFQSALSYGMTEDMSKQLIRMLANDIDMQSQISPIDSLEVFYPLPSDGDTSIDREILYVAANFSGTTRRYYRFQSSDGKVDYYNRDGRNSKQFLLRKPVPNGVFRSPFGARKHPVLGYVRMHTGVDWSAPRGSPIIAAGDGEVLKAGWSRGYGNHTEVRHANGFVSSYSHQNAFAKNIKPGVKVRQGQVIGYVGSTGLSTGPHCHYEVIVNGTKVDPMRIRLPDDKSLKGEELEAFKRDRDRIDALMNNGQLNNTHVASATPLTNG